MMAWRYSKIENNWASKPPVSDLPLMARALFSELHRYADRNNEGSLGKLGRQTPGEHLCALLRAKGGARGRAEQAFVREGFKKLEFHRILEIEGGEMFLTTFAPLHEQTRDIVGQRIREEGPSTPMRSPEPRTTPEKHGTMLPQSVDEQDAFDAYRTANGLPEGAPLKEYQATDARRHWMTSKVGF